MSEPTDVSDPTRNVLDLVRAETRRQDDLRRITAESLRREASIRAEYEDKLRSAEAARLDAIRRVDVENVQRAAEVQATAAQVIASQVATSATVVRAQVDAAEVARRSELTAALDPIQKDVADLRRAQYELVGQKIQTGESRLNVGAILGGISVLLVLVFGLVAVFSTSR